MQTEGKTEFALWESESVVLVSILTLRIWINITLAITLHVNWHTIYVCIYVCMHQFCCITTNIQDFLHNYLCNFITELHNVTKWASTDSYHSCCSVLTCYSNVNWSDSDWQFAHNFLFHSALLYVITKQHSTLSAHSSRHVINSWVSWILCHL